MTRTHRFVGAMLQPGTLWLVILAAWLVPNPAVAIEPVQAELGESEAWTGQRVPLTITLYSPGPFSGTASFDLPEIAGTVFVKEGNPLVGSKQVDGESYLTQRHEFAIYTQRSGEIVIPAFDVRFAGKPSFTADAEDVEGTTPEFRFQSKRPPGTASLGVVISAANINVDQRWTPSSLTQVDVGDVIERRIERTASGTTAMMMPDLSFSAPSGVRIYRSDPEVVDRVERGESSSRRIDVVKYQFEQSGTSELPEVVFRWWDPQSEQLQSNTLPGLTVEVIESTPVTDPQADVAPPSRSTWMLGALLGLSGVGLLAWFLRDSVGCWLQTVLAWWNRPEAIAERRLRSACHSNQAADAYRAMFQWLSLQRSGSGDDSLASLIQQTEFQVLETPWRELTCCLFEPGLSSAPWQGSTLWSAFRQAKRARVRHPQHRASTALPLLNPSLPDESTVR